MRKEKEINGQERVEKREEMKMLNLYVFRCANRALTKGMDPRPPNSLSVAP